MANSYTATSLQTSMKDRARFMLGDKGTLLDDSGAAVWLLQDEEITALVATFGFREGVAQLADGLVTQMGQQPTEYKDETGTDVKWADRMTAWRTLAANLRSGVIQDTMGSGSAPIMGQTTGPDMSKARAVSPSAYRWPY